MPDLWFELLEPTIVSGRLNSGITADVNLWTTEAKEEKMTRIAYQDAAPGAYKAMIGLEHYVRGSGLEHSLLELIKIRASQVNRCAYCLDMHTKDARAAGESEQRLYVLSAWREAPFYTARERAALAWTEAVTELGPDGVSDQLFRSTREHFEEKELVDLTMAIIVINGWNRLAIALQGEEVGSHVARR